MKKFGKLLMGLAGVLVASAASAGPITTFTGQDDGASTSGPWANSAAAETSFLAAAGPTNLIDFESLAVGFSDPIAAAAGVSIDLDAPDFGNGFSGISSTTLGSNYGFNTTSGGSQWLGFPGGSATFNFASGINAFGMWLTGLQTVFTSSLTLTFDDGASQTLTLPVNGNGGAQFFGFTDPGSSIVAITIANISNDAWGIDDVRYSSQSTVPEPAALALLGAGLVFVARRRRARQVR